MGLHPPTKTGCVPRTKNWGLGNLQLARLGPVGLHGNPCPAHFPAARKQLNKGNVSLTNLGAEKGGRVWKTSQFLEGN